MMKIQAAHLPIMVCTAQNKHNVGFQVMIFWARMKDLKFSLSKIHKNQREW